MTKRARDCGVVLGLLLAALVAGCAGDRMRRSTEEAMDDQLRANKVKVALYTDTEVHGRQMAVEAAHGVVQLRGVVASTAELQRAVQRAQGVKAVRQRLTVQGEGP